MLLIFFEMNVFFFIFDGEKTMPMLRKNKVCMQISILSFVPPEVVFTIYLTCEQRAVGFHTKRSLQDSHFHCFGYWKNAVQGGFILKNRTFQSDEDIVICYRELYLT